jgi:hypothetical protein
MESVLFSKYFHKETIMKISKKLLLTASALVAVSLVLLGLWACGPKSAGPSLVTDKATYAPGEAISVTFTAPAGLPENAWVGIIPSAVPHGDEATNDNNDLTYQYLKGMTAGTLTFAAPMVAGSYDFRMHDTDDGGKEIASVTFTVQ